MGRELVIYCDESDQKGKYFSSFYGGCLVESKFLEEVICSIEEKKTELNLFKEVKWSKITENYKDKYAELIDHFFDLIEEDKVKVRIMFTKNTHVAVGLTDEHKNNKYFLLYYQFVKHAFGLIYSGNGEEDVNVRVYFDELPDKKEKCQRFKEYIRRLSDTQKFQEARVKIKKDQIAEVDSNKHVLMQCFDIVLGAMQFRLNNKHKEKPKGSKRRGKKTIAKESIYKLIQKRIQGLYPFQFNIGISTGKHNGIESLWGDPYRHWLFLPSQREYDESKEKP